MSAVPCSLLQIAQTHDAERTAFTDGTDGERSTFGKLVARAVRCRRSMAHLGLLPGDWVTTDLGAGPDLAVLLLACWESGLQLRIEQPGAPGRSIRMALNPARLVVTRDTKPPCGRHVRQLSVAQLEEVAAAARSPDPLANPATATITAGPGGDAETMSAAALLQSAANFKAAFTPVAGQTLLSTSTPTTLEGVCISTVIPLALGLNVICAGEAVANTPVVLQPAAEHVEFYELAASTIRGLLQDSTVPRLPAHLRAVVTVGPLPPAKIVRAEQAFGHQVHQGYGTPQTGFWAAVTSSGGQICPANYIASIRELRSPLRILGADPACTTGEIVLRPAQDDASSIRTGDVGWLTPAGALTVAGRLSDVSVRGGQAILLTDVDRLLSGLAAVRESRTFREHGVSPTEPTICVCVTEASEASVREWLINRLGPGLVPSRIVTVSASLCGALPRLDTLRSVATGRSGQAVAAALTARRFRRNPAYDEAGLMEATNTALLSGGTLDFLMFWGCGPRRHEAAPDRAAIDALGELLAAAEAAAPLRARAYIICTDLHATNNGHSEAHFSAYFAAIRSLAAGLDVSFELESAVWRRGELSKKQVLALEQEPEFEQRWRNFPLRSRFVQQASRHSGLADKTQAARHYYATCLLERAVLKSLFARSVFLTYNGPEFNECFPDLPTLYVYPGPRGRNDKPWFVALAGQQAVHEAQVAAE